MVGHDRRPGVRLHALDNRQAQGMKVVEETPETTLVRRGSLGIELAHAYGDADGDVLDRFR